MKYILIDNCSLRHLICNHGYSKFIVELETMVSSKKIKLLTHDLVIEEWEKHKDKWKKEKERKINYIANTHNISSEEKSLIPFNQQVTNIHLDEQIKKIDDLLSNSMKLSTPQGIKDETHERLRKKLAPFTKKSASLNDWEIFGTVANYCQLYNIDQLFFISHNHTDFGNENNTERSVHTTLIERFNSVHIVYYRNIHDFFEDFNSDSFLPSHLIKYQIIKSSKYSHAATIKSNVLDALFDLYNNKYREINFIPHHILSKCFPFTTSENSHVYSSNFRLSYVNPTLIDFIGNIEKNEKNEILFKDISLVEFIPDYREKIKYVLRHLTQNLIFHLSGENSRDAVCTHYNANEACHCYRCSHDIFDFLSTFQDIRKKSLINKEKLKQAYINYQLGNYLTANNIYEEILSSSFDKKEYIIYFLTKYNQRHLGSFLDNFMVSKDIDKNLISALKDIDPVEEAVKLKAYSDYNFMIFIAQEDFFNYAFQKINEAVKSIIDHYYSQLKSGWSSNSHVWNLIEEYAQLDTLLNNNYIIYDNYSNFSRLFELVIEGLFASHAISETQQSRLKCFDDYWVNKFIFYGNKNAFIKYFNRYKLKSLKYKSDGQNEPLINLANNILTYTEEGKETIENLSDTNNNFFSSSFNKYFVNFLTITSLLDLENNVINEIATKLLHFLKVEKILYRNEYESVRFFLDRKKKYIEKSILLEYFEFLLNNIKNHDYASLETIIECFEDNSLTEITDQEFNLILNQSLILCEKCKETHSPHILISLFAKVDFLKKEEISQKIIEKLNQKFDFDMFSLATLYEIIPTQKDKVLSLIDEYIINIKNYTFRSVFSGERDFQNHYIDQLINLCFKLDIDTTEGRFAKLKEIHPYYEWVLDMESFDYKNFNPEWVIIHQITYYYKRMSQSRKLIDALVNYLDTNFHYEIERTLIQITYYAKE